MKKGISLITLIITIVVIIILAAAVILSLSQNNPIQTSRVASVVQTKDNIESGILVYVGNVQAKTLGNYSTEQILTQNSEYKIVEDTAVENKITVNNIDLYKLDTSRVKNSINMEIKNEGNGEWYIAGNGKVYLVYEDLTYIPEYYKVYGSLSNNLKGFVVPKNENIRIVHNLVYNSSSGNAVIRVIAYRNIPNEKTIELTGYLYLRDGTLDSKNTVEEVNEVLRLENVSNNQSIVQKIAPDTVNVNGYGNNIVDYGSGIWIRGYVVLTAGTVIYTDSVYDSISGLDIVCKKETEVLKFDLSRDVVEVLVNSTALTDATQNLSTSVVSSGIIYVKDGVTLTESSTVDEANTVLVVDSTDSNVIKETDSSTAHKNTFSKEITDDGNGVWARGYVTISYGEYTKTLYTNSVYKKIN